MTNLERAADRVEHSFREEFLSLAADNPNLAYVVKALSAGRPGARELFEVAVRRLPGRGRRPDSSLAAYFLILSELKDIPEEARSFAIDAMVYCETDTDELVPRGYEALLWEFDEVRPLL